MNKLTTVISSIVLITLLSAKPAQANQKVLVIAIIDHFAAEIDGGILELILKNFVHDLSADADLMVMATGIPTGSSMNVTFPVIKILSKPGTSRVQILQQIENFKPGWPGMSERDESIRDYQTRNRYMSRLFESLAAERPLLIVRFASNSPFGPLDQFAVTLDDSVTRLEQFSHPMLPWSSCYDRIKPFKHIAFAQMGYFARGVNGRARDCMAELNVIHKDASVLTKKPSDFLKRYSSFKAAIHRWIQAQPNSSKRPLTKLVPDVSSPEFKDAGFVPIFSNELRLAFQSEIAANSKRITAILNATKGKGPDFVFDTLRKNPSLRTTPQLREGYIKLAFTNYPGRVALSPESRFLISQTREPIRISRDQSAGPGECLFEEAGTSKASVTDLSRMVSFGLDPATSFPAAEPVRYWEHARVGDWVLISRGGESKFEPGIGAIACRFGPTFKTAIDIVGLFTKAGFTLTGRGTPRLIK